MSNVSNDISTRVFICSFEACILITAIKPTLTKLSICEANFQWKKLICQIFIRKLLRKVPHFGQKMDLNDDNILDAEDYRKLVLGIILSEKEVSRPVFQLRFLLFIRAAHYHYQHYQSQCLEPFPSCFFDPVTKTRLYDVLRTHISNIPELNTIQVNKIS